MKHAIAILVLLAGTGCCRYKDAAVQAAPPAPEMTEKQSPWKGLRPRLHRHYNRPCRCWITPEIDARVDSLRAEIKRMIGERAEQREAGDG